MDLQFRRNIFKSGRGVHWWLSSAVMSNKSHVESTVQLFPSRKQQIIQSDACTCCMHTAHTAIMCAINSNTRNKTAQILVVRFLSRHKANNKCFGNLALPIAQNTHTQTSKHVHTNATTSNNVSNKNAQLLVVRFLGRNDRRIRRQHEVNARIWHQVRLRTVWSKCNAWSFS